MKSNSTIRAATPQGELPSDGRYVCPRRSYGDKEKNRSGFSIVDNQRTAISITIGMSKRTQPMLCSVVSTADSDLCLSQSSYIHVLKAALTLLLKAAINHH
ncbi:hypothetical protein F0562_028496 [Nyssa sinensis]|uniref:Uncharacterized protein n=1 Tax=Nyssa sinensis TaxID=561372 RepID=A0A5J5B0F5_9ASTE|nr:hypothetical protein F0562_028496 [Nyssa sinensis]